jgi:hypothetical protein
MNKYSPVGSSSGAVVSQDSPKKVTSMTSGLAAFELSFPLVPHAAKPNNRKMKIKYLGMAFSISPPQY